MTAKFQGRYVNEIREVLKASALSGQHAHLMGGPGRGKTTIARAVMLAIFGDRHVFHRFNPTTPPEKVTGLPNMQLLMEENKYELVLNGTFYDPNAMCFLADEASRAHDAIFDIMLDVMDRQDINPADAPVVWATSNFQTTSERTAALRDRYALVWWDPNETLDTRAIVENQLSAIRTGLSVEDSLPTIDDVIAARNAQPGEKAVNAVATVIENLTREAQKGVSEKRGDQEQIVARFNPHPRRFDQWGKILFRYGFWLAGNDSDFDEVPQEARNVLQYAWPTADEQEARHWQAVCEAVADPIEAAINSLTKQSYEKFKQLMAENQGADMQSIAQELGVILSEGQREINELAEKMGLDKKDKRIGTALFELQDAFAQIINNRNPFA